MTVATVEGIAIAELDRAGILTLDRPQQRHALTAGMLQGMRAALDAWAKDDSIVVVLLEASDEGFCGGADLGALCKGPAPDNAMARAYWRDGALLASAIARFPKPIVALVDGLAAGSGVGLIAHATYRVVTERARLAMPETTIGLVPDMAVTWLLSRTAGPLGTCLALTGHSLDAAGAIHAGLADGHIPANQLAAMRDRLISPFGGPIERVLNSFAVEAGPIGKAISAPLVRTAFSEPSLERIIAALAADDEHGASFAQALAGRSPLAAKLTLALLNKVQNSRTIEAALVLEHRILSRLFEYGELQEGVRARLIDGSRTPNWAFARPEDVDQMLLNSFFAPMLPGEDLRFTAAA